MDALNQVIQGRHGAPVMTAGELAMKWEMGILSKQDLMLHYGISEKQIFEFSKAVKAAKKSGPLALTKCANCSEEIDDVSFKEGACGKCGQELRYGLDGCGG